jgi:hypothetical protein
MAKVYQGELDRSYQLYCRYCERLEVPPANYEVWQKMSSKISDSYFHSTKITRSTSWIAFMLNRCGSVASGTVKFAAR